MLVKPACGVFHDLKPLTLLQNINQPVEEF